MIFYQMILLIRHGIIYFQIVLFSEIFQSSAALVHFSLIFLSDDVLFCVFLAVRFLTEFLSTHFAVELIQTFMDSNVVFKIEKFLIKTVTTFDPTGVPSKN
jgi:uncharacterized membrane protein